MLMMYENSHINWFIYKINNKAITVHVYQSGIFFLMALVPGSNV